MNDLVQYSLLSFLIGTCLGMLFKGYLNNKYLRSKTNSDSAIYIDGKFYYLVSETKYIQMSIPK